MLVTTLLIELDRNADNFTQRFGCPRESHSLNIVASRGRQLCKMLQAFGNASTIGKLLKKM